MESLGVWMFPALLLLVVTGFPIAFSMLVVALIFGYLRFGDSVVFHFVTRAEDVASNYVLGAIPLFIFMGAMLERSGLADRLFEAIHMWTRRLPGGLAIGTVVMATIFACSTGVVGATETVVGMLAVPAMMKYGYDKSLISGTVCAGGSLGTAIPPSITVIVLAPVATLPVGDLFAAILLPGLLMALLFLLYVLIASTVRPGIAPRVPESELQPIPLGYRLRVTGEALLPPIILIFAVLGTILAGWATPTEAAACGAFGSLLLAGLRGRITIPVLREALYATIGITAMILLIVLAGSIFAGIFYTSGGMNALQNVLDAYGLSGWPAIALILFITFLAGFVLDLISITLIIIPVAMPLVRAYGVDPLWFAVLFLIVLQTAYLTPPMAPSIFYLRAIAPPSITLLHMYRGVVPFILLQVLTAAIVVQFPGLATWLPRALYGN